MKDRFEHILQEKLRDYSMKPELRDWDVLERSLGLEKPKRMPLYRYVAAAAVLLLLVGAGFYLTRTGDVLPDGGPLVSLAPPEDPIQKIERSTVHPDPALDAINKLKTTIDESYGRAVANPGAGTQIVPYPEDGPAARIIPENRQAAGQTSGQSGRNASTDRTRVGQGGNRTENSGFMLADNTPAVNRNRRNANWALSLFADGSGSGSGKAGGDRTQFSSALHAGDLMAIRASGTLIHQEYDNQTGLFKTEVGEWKHDLPLTFGLMARYNFNDHWGIETGITYSYLTSKQKVSSVQLKQKLHYLGVPLAVTYTPFHTKNFEFYGRLGGAADFNIAGRKGVLSEGNDPVYQKFTRSGVQWSASANIGAMYNLSPVVGIYLEPGVSHYFDFSNQPESYWKEHPTNFNLKIGIRTNF